VIVADRLDHVSIFLGAKLSGAELRSFPHNNVRMLEDVLTQCKGPGKILVVVEGLYSVDGDFGKIDAICEVARRYGAIVMVDEAHAVGVAGPKNAGAADRCGVIDQVDIILGTMSKALGSSGGFVAARQEIIDILKLRTPFYVNTTNLTPAAVGASVAALEILAEEGVALARTLDEKSLRVRNGLREAGIRTIASESAVIPVLIGDPVTTGKVALWLRERGLMVGAITSPLVKAKQDRLRLCVNVTHTNEECDRAVALVAEARKLFAF